MLGCTAHLLRLSSSSRLLREFHCSVLHDLLTKSCLIRCHYASVFGSTSVAKRNSSPLHRLHALYSAMLLRQALSGQLLQVAWVRWWKSILAQYQK